MNSLNFTNFLLVIFGGGLGSAFRYLTFELVNAALKKGLLTSVNFPWATFVVNLSGSMFAGFFYFFLIRNFGESNQYLRHFLLVGFLGGFTTFSAFSLDFFRLFIAGHYFQAFIYALASVFLSILALFFGFNLAKIFG